MSIFGGNHFTKKQLFVIAKIAFLEAIAISFIVPVIQSTGETIPQCQSGHRDVLIPGSSNAQSASVNIIYSPSFSAKPRLSLLINGTSGSIFSQFYQNVEFQGPGNVGGTLGIWTAMPNAETELYGTTTNEIDLDTISYQNVFFEVNVVQTGAANSKLGIQYSLDSGGTWIDISGSFVFIDSLGLQESSGASLGNAQTTGQPTLYRIAGVGGNGVRSPQFGLIEARFQATVFNVLAEGNNQTPTGFTLFVARVTQKKIDATIKVDWSACFP